MYDIENIRTDFPISSRQVNGKPLVYLDNGASAQKPSVVIDAISNTYGMEYSNVHRGLHFLSNLATDNYEAVRGKIARFLNAASEPSRTLSTGCCDACDRPPRRAVQPALRLLLLPPRQLITVRPSSLR